MTSSVGKPQPSSRGFTVTELMVVMVIMTLLAGLAVPNFARSLESERLRLGGRMVIGMMELARSRAIAGHVHTRLVLDRQEGRVSLESLSQPTSGSQSGSSTLSAEQSVATWEEMTDNLAQARALPNGVTVASVTKAEQSVGNTMAAVETEDADQDTVLFRPDGTSESVLVTLDGAREDDRLVIQLEKAKLMPRVLDLEEVEKLGGAIGGSR